MEDFCLTSQQLPLNSEAPEWQNKTLQCSPFDVFAKSVPQTAHAPLVSGNIQLLLRKQQGAIMASTLHQPDAPVFTGDHMEYCGFTCAFENLIDRKKPAV